MLYVKKNIHSNNLLLAEYETANRRQLLCGQINGDPIHGVQMKALSPNNIKVQLIEFECSIY